MSEENKLPKLDAFEKLIDDLKQDSKNSGMIEAFQESIEILESWILTSQAIAKHPDNFTTAEVIKSAAADIQAKLNLIKIEVEKRDVERS